MSLGVLIDLHQPSIVTKTLQEAVEPLWDIRTATAHEINLLLSDSYILKHSYLLAQCGCEPRRIAAVVAVGETVFNLCARVILYYGATHGEFIKIVVGKVSDYLSHNVDTKPVNSLWNPN